MSCTILQLIVGLSDLSQTEKITDKTAKKVLGKKLVILCLRLCPSTYPSG
jgi:hypothetical protein